MVLVNGLWGKLALEFVEVLEALPYIVRKTENEKFSFLTPKNGMKRTKARSWSLSFEFAWYK